MNYNQILKCLFFLLRSNYNIYYQTRQIDFINFKLKRIFAKIRVLFESIGVKNTGFVDSLIQKMAHNVS